MGHPRYRPDIDGLRAVAVLSVVGFHAFPETLTGGFIGVDVFFVISGYLISTIIMSALEDDAFSYLDFYGRRIRRILPALIVVLAATLALGWALLLPAEFKELGKHVVAGAAFVTNFVSWRETGYFDNAAADKPLLHLWSLGIEEQFYIFWPIIVGLAWKARRVGWTIVACAVLSFAVGLYLLRDNPVAAFYSPLSRFWELMIGALLAHWNLGRSGPSRHGDAKATLGLLLLGCGLVVISETSAFPGWLALLPTLGTALLIAAGPTSWINRTILSQRALVAIGLVSYPLYLWHWPLLAVASVSMVDPLSVEMRVVIVLLSAVLAWLTFVFVERPIRTGAHQPLQPLALLAGLGGLGIVGVSVFLAVGMPSRSVPGWVRGSVAVSPVEDRLSECDPAVDPNTCIAHFGRGAPLRVVLWGDSHARMWAAALAEVAKRRDFELLAVASDGCPPLSGVRMGVAVNHVPSCATLGTQDGIVAQVLEFKPDLVILAARWSMYANGWIVKGKLEKKNTYLTAEPTGPATLETARKALAKRIPATIDAFLERSIPVMVVRNPPVLRYDVRNARKTVAEIEVSRAEHDRMSAFTDAIFAGIPGLHVLDAADRLCDSTCKARLGSDYLYVDDNHLGKASVRLFADDLEATMARALASRAAGAKAATP